MRTRLMKNQRGAALIETAITLPIILLISVAIFEFGRAYQTWQVLTNASREGARVSVITSTPDGDVTAAVRNYMTSGRLTAAGTAGVNVERSVPMGACTASRVTVNYPFQFVVLNPVARLVVRGTKNGSAPLTMQAVTFMRNEC